MLKVYVGELHSQKCSSATLWLRWKTAVFLINTLGSLFFSQHQSLNTKAHVTRQHMFSYFQLIYDHWKKSLFAMHFMVDMCFFFSVKMWNVLRHDNLKCPRFSFKDSSAYHNSSINLGNPHLHLMCRETANLGAALKKQNSLGKDSTSPCKPSWRFPVMFCMTVVEECCPTWSSKVFNRGQNGFPPI